MDRLNRTTRLSVLRALVHDSRQTDDQLNPRLVTSIQQSLAAEGYEFSEESVLRVGERELR